MPGPGSYIPTTGETVTHTLEWVEETTPGTFPSNPAMNWAGVDLTYDDSPNMNTIALGNLGSENVQYQIGGKQEYVINTDFAIQNSNLLKYLVNSQGGGTGTIDKTLSLLIAPKINGTTNYLQVLQARPDSGKITWSEGKETRASISFRARSIPAYVTSDPVGAGSHAADPNTNPFKFDDVGSGGVTLAGTAYDFQDVSITFGRNLKEFRPLGYAQALYNPPTRRDITGDFTIMLEDSSIYGTSLLTQTPVSLVVPLKLGTSVLTMTNCTLNKTSKSIKVKDMIFEKFSFRANLATLT